MITRRLLIALPLLFAGWIAVMASVMLFSDAAPAAVVILPPDGFAARLPDGTGIIAAGPLHLTLKNDTPRFARALYAAGARLVLPAGLTGCLPLPRPGKPAG
ncbi:hypothetical protein [Oceaniglobus trochenteri]|uniref:hypothetical protein n=1 Tax=Oceaniglobus trochenteri TaxID=2763260 RepID=UPI001CFFB28D|nr:hypothetical protein [Oceaniglobus trochenteri]